MASVTSLDHDMRKLRLERYTPSAANEVKSWIEETLGEQLNGELLNALKDGVALCKLVNLALPPPGIKFKASNMPFTQRENISHFLTACERPPFNMPSHDRFLTVDLYDEKDPAQVIQCIGAFSRAANAINPQRFPTVIGPKRGAPSPTRKTAEGSSYSTAAPSTPSRGVSNISYGSPSPVTATKSPPSGRYMSPSFTGGSTGSRTPDSAARGPVSSWSKKVDEGQTAPAWNIHQYGYMGGASQGNQGVVFGAPRQITTPAVHVPSAAEKQARMRQQELEAEKEAQRRREEEEQRARERQAQIEAEEEQARIEEHRRWEEETRRAQLREQEDAERQRLEMEKERDELRQARDRERQEVERDKEERRKREERRREQEEQARRDAVASKTPVVPAGATRQNSEVDRIKELERQLAQARERERQWKMQQESGTQRPVQAPSEDATISPDQSFTAGDDARLPIAASEPTPAPAQVPMRSGGPRPLPNPKPAVAPKPRNTPFTRPSKPLDPPQAEIRPPAPLSATAEPPSDDTQPSKYSSARPAHVTRTDEYLSSNPAPTAAKPASYMSEELGMSSTSERAAEDARRAASQQKTKAGGWASKSLLEREMERERERQKEWEENQMAKARAAGMNRGIMGPRAMNSKAP